MANTYVEIECDILAITEMALKIDNDGNSEIWVPKSLIDPATEDYETETSMPIIGVTLRIQEWFCIKKNMV